jgi:hypothetical protein
MVYSHNEPSNPELINNFNKIKLCCIGCGSENLETSAPRVAEGDINIKETVVCEQFIKINQLEQERMTRFVITCLTCKDCGQRFTLKVLDHGK